MSRKYGYAITLLGHVIALVSFCLLPYIEVVGTSITFTGLQLTQLESQIPLPNYYPYSVIGLHVQGVLRNDPFFIRPIMVLLVLTGAFTIANVAVAVLWPRQRLIAWLALPTRYATRCKQASSISKKEVST